MSLRYFVTQSSSSTITIEAIVPVTCPRTVYQANRLHGFGRSKSEA